MSESIWHHEACSPGRSYMLGKDPYIKYGDSHTIIVKIVEGLREFVHAEPAVRLTLDSKMTNPERAILAIPFESDQEVILYNFAQLIYQSLMGYYISANPRTTHFGLSNLVLEGNVNSVLRREMEKLIAHFQNRYDMAGRLIQNVGLVGKNPVPKAGNTFLSETIKKGLDIHVGYRIFATGENVNCTQIFIPLQAGNEIIDMIYYNIERIIHHDFVTYDETGDTYLNITETLVFRELEGLLQRSKNKELTRNKMLNNLQFNMVVRRSEEVAQLPIMGDRLYDVLNRVQDTKIREATDRSRDLYVYAMTGTANIIQDQLRFPEVAQQIGLQVDGQGIPGAGAQIADGMQQTRRFMRRTSEDGGRRSRRRFQKVTLTEAELNPEGTKVPSPPTEETRVPDRGRRISRITR